MVRAAALWIAQAIREAVRERGHCAMALAGGTTPGPIYRELATPPLAREVEWPLVEVYFGDERAVPPNHSDSNFHRVHEWLLAHVPIPETGVHRMAAERPNLEAAAVEYDHALPPRLDLLVLGLGPDGHIASLFPGSPALAERLRRVVPVSAPQPPQWRLTITPPVIGAARKVAVVAVGQKKAAVVARALTGELDPVQVPAQLARHGAWFLDPQAASALTPGWLTR